MAWTPVIHDLTRKLNHDTLVALAGKLAAADGPVQDLKFEWLRNWDRGDNGAQCQWTLNDLSAPISMLPVISFEMDVQSTSWTSPTSSGRPSSLIAPWRTGEA